MHIKRVLQHTKCAVLVCCERAITFVPEIIWRVTYKEIQISYLKYFKISLQISKFRRILIQAEFQCQYTK